MAKPPANLDPIESSGTASGNSAATDPNTSPQLGAPKQVTAPKLGGAPLAANAPSAVEAPAVTESPAGTDSGTDPECVFHSFTGSTQVLMADGSTKPIDQVKVGDQITDSAPGKAGTETHKVEAVIVTTTDHDFVDVTIKPATTPSSLKTKLAALYTQGAVDLGDESDVWRSTRR